MIGHQAHKNITASRFGIIVTAEGWSEVAALTEMNKPLDTGRLQGSGCCYCYGDAGAWQASLAPGR